MILVIIGKRATPYGYRELEGSIYLIFEVAITGKSYPYIIAAKSILGNNPYQKV